MTATSVRAPGKLYVAGEYAVVIPGNTAILVAVDRFMTVTVTPHSDRKSEFAGTLTSDATDGNTVSWYLFDGSVAMDATYAHRTEHLRSALGVVGRYLTEHNCTATAFDIDVTSTMTSPTGVKLGLGSSGAITVAVIAAVLIHHGFAVVAREVYRLAMVATATIDSTASGGDLAAAAYGGWIHYTSPDRVALRDAYRAGRKVSDIIVDDTWPDRHVVHVPAPDPLVLQVGWTGTPASTTEQVGQLRYISHIGEQSASPLATFAAASTDLVSGMKDAMLDHNAELFAAHVGHARSLLNGLERTAGISIETPRLRALCESAEMAGAAAKSSGAGGGDCGVAFTSTPRQRSQVAHAWRLHAIEPLNLRSYDHTIEVNN